MRVDPAQSVAAFEPGDNGGAQFATAERGRITCQPAEVGRQRVPDESRCGVLRLPNRQPDFVQVWVWRHAGKELSQLLEGIGLQLAEVGIHWRMLRVAGRWIIRGIEGW